MTDRPNNERRSRGWGWLLVLLPVLLPLGWFVYEQFPAWTFNPPEWLRVNDPAAVDGACAAVASVRTYNGRFVSGEPPVSAAEAREQANTLVAAQHDLPPGDFVSQPGTALVRATFPPDQQNRLAWLHLAVIAPVGADDTEPGKLALVYIDAETGEPLAYSVVAAVRSPDVACPPPPVSRRALLRAYLPLVLAVGYVGLVGSGWVVLAWRRRRSL